MTRLASRFGARTALASALVACALVAAAGGDVAGGALRAMAVVALLAAGVLATRHMRAGPAHPATVTVTERHLIGKDVGVALVTAEGRRLLVGYGPAGIGLLADLTRRCGDSHP